MKLSFEDVKTFILNEKVKNIRKVDELKKHYDDCSSRKRAWAEQICRIVEKQKTVRQFAKECNVSPPAVYDWCRGSFPASREQYIKIGFAAGYNFEEMNDFLKNTALTYELCAKNSLEDNVFQYGLNRKPRLSFLECKELQAKIEERICLEKEKQSSEGDKELTLDSKTTLINQHIVKLGWEQSDDEFIEWASKQGQNDENFTKLCKKINEYKHINYHKNGFKELKDGTYFFGDTCWEEIIDIVEKGKWIPQREKLIELGIYLNCNYTQINELLELARMKGLTSKIPIEAFTINVLEKVERLEGIRMDGSPNLHDEWLKMREFMNYNEKLIVVDKESVKQYDLKESRKITSSSTRDGSEWIKVNCQKVDSKQGAFHIKDGNWLYADNSGVRHKCHYLRQGKDQRIPERKGIYMKHRRVMGFNLRGTNEERKEGVLMIYLQDSKNKLIVKTLSKSEYSVGNKCKSKDEKGFDCGCDIIVNDRYDMVEFFKLKKENEKWYVIWSDGEQKELLEKEVIFSNGYNFIFANGKLIYNDYENVKYF